MLAGLPVLQDRRARTRPDCPVDQAFQLAVGVRREHTDEPARIEPPGLEHGAGD